MASTAVKVENDLRRDDIGRLVRRIALPSMLAQFVSVLYSIVDRIYIGNIAEVGELALAGVGVCGPTVTLVAATAFWVSVGGAPLMSIRMGQGDEKAASRILSNCFLMLLLFAAFVMALLLPLRHPLLRLFGASEVSLPYASAYFTLYMLGTPFALLATGLNQLIICQGFAKVGMQAVLLGAFLNIALDPVFIFGLGMGVRGAALATVLSQMASAAFALRFLRSDRAAVRLKVERLDPRVCGRVLMMGVSPFIITSSDSIMIIAMNGVLQHYGGMAEGDFLLTCNTILQSFMLMITMPMVGISGGTQCILGYNYGAGKPKRVLKAEKYITAWCVGFAVIMFVLARVAGQYFVLLFSRDPAVIETTYWAIRVSTIALVPMAVQYALVDGLTGLGKVANSLPLSAFRKILFLVSVFVLPLFFGAHAVFYAELISDTIAPAVTTIVFLSTIGRLLKTRPPKGTI